MRLLINTLNRTIHDASNSPMKWQVNEEFEAVDVPGDAEKYSWPNGEPTRCKLTIDLQIIPDPSWVAPVDKLAIARIKVAVLPPGPFRDALEAVLETL